MKDDSVLVENVLRTIASRQVKRGGGALWSVVGQLFAIGSTSSYELCRRFGFDPNIIVRRRIQL